MYESPINLITDRVMKDFVKKQDAYILQEVVRLGVDIDKEELLRALMYDREQYEAGYADGKRDAVKHGWWSTLRKDGYHLGVNCSECKTTWDFPSKFCPYCGSLMDLEVGE